MIRNYFIALGLIGSFLVVYFWPFLNNRVFISLQSGENGVLWRRFFKGTDLNYTYSEGFHLVMPWDRLQIYNIRLQQTPHKVLALCKNGLPVEIEVSIRHRPQRGLLPLLHSVVGPNYVDTVVKPEIEAHVRAVVSQFDPAELYTSEGYILNLIVQGAHREITERYVDLDDLLIKRIVLPTKIADAIESKLTEEQRIFELEFRVQQAVKEAQRKEIESKGILAFQEAVASGGSFKDYLRYAGIQATVELSKSENAKIVVIGGADGGLPLILNLPPDDLAQKPSKIALKNPLPAPTNPAELNLVPPSDLVKQASAATIKTSESFTPTNTPIGTAGVAPLKKSDPP